MKPGSRNAFCLVGAAALVAMLSGCGWTARDEYLMNQRAAVSARPGDGSFLASEWKAGRERELHAAEVAARFGPPN